MRVLFLTREFPPNSVGGIAKHILWLSDNLSRLGITCKVLSYGDPSDSNDMVTFITPESSLSPGKVRLRDNLMILRDIRRIDKIADDLLKKEEFDIIHVEDPYLGPFLQSPRVVTTVHDTSVGELHSMIHNVHTIVDVKYSVFFASLGPILERLTLSRTRKIIAVSKHIKNELAKYYFIPFNKIKVIPNGVVVPSILSKYGAKKKLGFSADNVVILSVSRLIPRKRLDILIRALELLTQNGINNFTAIICGDGPQKLFLQNLVRKKNLSEKVKIKGWVSEELLRLYYEAADIFALTSEYEGHPISLLEALAYNDASVCSDIPSVMLTDGIDVLKFRCGNPEELSQKLELLIRRPDLRHTIARAGMKVVRQFEWQKVASETREVYEELRGE